MVVLDIIMPKMDGLSVMEKFAMMKSQKRSVIYCSFGSGTGEDHRKCI